MIQMYESHSKVFGTMATVFHRTRKEDIVDFISKSGFLSSLNGLYGDGVYATYSIESQQTQRMLRNYGSFLIKAVVNLSNNFIIFDDDISRKVYGKRVSVKEQLDRHGLRSVSAITADAALRLPGLNPGLERKVSGLVFTGKSDGNVIVVYDPKLIIPVSWSYSDEDYLSIPPNKINWNKISSYKHLSKSLKAIMNKMERGSRGMRHTRKDPDWDGAYSWVNGVWEGGIWDTGIWLDGLWERGTFKNGVWHDGHWLDGRWKNGVWMGGTFHNGIWYDGVWHGGIWKEGTWWGGVWKGGYNRHGIYKETAPSTW